MLPLLNIYLSSFMKMQFVWKFNSIDRIRDVDSLMICGDFIDVFIYLWITLSSLNHFLYFSFRTICENFQSFLINVDVISK